MGRLNPLKLPLKDGFISVSDAVLIRAKRRHGDAIFPDGLEQVLPFYVKTIRRKGVSIVSVRRNYFEREKDGYGFYYEEIELPVSLVAVAHAAWPHIRDALHELIKLVLDSKIVGRLEPLSDPAQELDSESGVVFRSQRVTALTSSMMWFGQRGGKRQLAVILFPKEAVTTVQSPDEGTPFVNGVGRQIKPTELQRLSDTAELLCSFANEKKAGHQIPKIDEDLLVRIVASAADVPISKAKYQTSADGNSKPVAFETVVKFVREHSGLSIFRRARGRPSKPDRTLMERFLIQLCVVQGFEKARQLIEHENS